MVFFQLARLTRNVVQAANTMEKEVVSKARGALARRLAMFVTLVAGCGNAEPGASTTTTPSPVAPAPAPTGVANNDDLTTTQGDSADTSCNLDLRTAYVTLDGRAGPESDCSTGTCWAIINGTFDVSAAAQADSVDSRRPLSERP